LKIKDKSKAFAIYMQSRATFASINLNLVKSTHCSIEWPRVFHTFVTRDSFSSCNITDSVFSVMESL